MSASDLPLASFFKSRPVDQPPGRGLFYSPAFHLFCVVKVAKCPETRFLLLLMLTATATAFRWPINTRIFLPQVLFM